jgi:hypothetical protein
MTTLHFVKLVLGNKNYKEQVSTDGCSNVSGFRAAIKKKLSPLLDSYATAQLVLCQPDGITEIHPATAVKDLTEIPWKPMVVTVDELPIPAPIGSSKKQLTYKGIGVEASCRKYFDALARKLALFYRFKWGQDDENDYPTFGDVLFAYKNNAWNFICRQKSYAERTDESGFTQVAAPVPILSVRLPDLFDADEWVKLKEWNQKTNSRIHDADLPKTSTGKYFVIIPHADYNQETIQFFKTIGVKGKLYDNGSKLEVKDESGLPDKDKKM